MQMSETEFLIQMQRLTSAYGEKAFDRGRMELISRHVRDLSPYGFSRIVDHLLSNFRQAPLPKDFAEAARAERNSFSDARSVPEYLDKNIKNDGGLKKVLEREYPGCTNLKEAIEVRKLKNRIEKINNEPDGAA